MTEEGGVTCWLNQPPDLHKYWDDGSYIETTEAYAEKIFYYTGDHSAVPSTTHPGMYVSKWGLAPLMRHAPNDGPEDYNMNKRKYYYKKRVVLSGPFMMGGAETGSCSINYIPHNYTLTWRYFNSSLLTLVSSSAKGIVLKPKTTTTLGDVTVEAKLTHNTTGREQNLTRNVGLNGPHQENVELVVTKSSDGSIGYPTGGLCPDTYYYAYLRSNTPLTNVNWGASSQLFVISSSNDELYFQTSSAGFGVLNVTARTVYGLTKVVKSVTLFGGGSNCGPIYYSVGVDPSSNVVDVRFDMAAFTSGINEMYYTNKRSFDIRMHNVITGVMVKQAHSSGENVRIDVSNVPNGIYLVHIYDGISDTPQVYKITIKH